MRNGWQSGILMVAAVMFGIWELGDASWHVARLWPVQVIASSIWPVLKSQWQVAGSYGILWLLPFAMLAAGIMTGLVTPKKDHRSIGTGTSTGESHD